MTAPAQSDERVQITADVECITSQAMLILDHDSGKKVWLPLALIRDHEWDGDDVCTFTIPEKLAIDKELI